MYNKAKELKDLCVKTGKEIWQIAIDKDFENTGIEEADLLELMHETLEVMRDSAYKGLDQAVYSMSKITGGSAVKANKYAEDSVSGKTITRAMAMALSVSEVNSSMGRIVAAPTAGASGILPAALFTMQEKYGYDDDKLVEALIVAGVIGEIIAQNASISGAEGGCQAECGSAAAMAAAAICYLRDFDIDTIFASAAFAIKNILGLVCDPVLGLVEYPCNLRNASGVVNAIISADLAMSGFPCLIPLDETIDSMRQVGNSLPEALRETALGGLAATPTAEKLGEEMEEKNAHSEN
ncbi:MAG: L-serine ammonia-lyase, iron-sulfur-dependent, subunit alpha [Ezakiella sp.]|uniref:L-serine ammonia-lyase, iron-sulfur-dependent, subunit alpha n=1 Tax=Ezakiella sp. TaxID=1935205 RepID=UPI002975224F|nr:L-serine ammonia-lyase, iron-sulfur-dependent, subunit alpha [Ezakiella sp.]MDD7731770.1 L-serine ammonia-lyase, iron-sulfur-dependent, subunit alpha [Eubacteriales bacterium]MDY6080091.1 L-serine ammonia-lyase, iron-sulfur-dependent, subunit alpha [Ezakiella sp.]